VVVYVLFVHSVAKQVSATRSKIEGRRDQLRAESLKGNKIPNPTMIRFARENAERVSALLDQCELYLARQPRWAHTIRFFTEGPYGPEIEVPLDRPNDWLTLYHQYNQELQQQLVNAGMPYTVQTLDWGTSVPTPEGIAAAMEIYWFQKDLIDFLTQQVEKDFATYLDFKAKGRADPFPAKPYDLVVNTKPARLDEFLRSISRDKLVAVLGAIVVNREQQDLATIFNTLLPDEKKPDGTIAEYGFPWERPASDRGEHNSVRGFTMDEAQEKFLAEMLPPGKPDLSNRQRFLDYVMELRMVRYRADVIGLLESHHFDTLAAALRRGTEEELSGILSDIADVNGIWTTTRIAEAISAIVSINNPNDFALVRNNHSPEIAALVNLTLGASEAGVLTGAGGREGGGRGAVGGRRVSHDESGSSRTAGAAGPGADMYKVRTFDMQVRLRFERIPVFVRRLISNSWRYRVQIIEVLPVETIQGRGAGPAGMGAPAGGGRGVAPGRVGGRRTRDEDNPGEAPATAGAPRRNRAAETPLIEAGNFVVLHLTGEAYQFSPLMAKYRNKLDTSTSATPAVPAPAGRPATPTGAR
jgi:hypothetical protein